LLTKSNTYTTLLQDQASAQGLLEFNAALGLATALSKHLILVMLSSEGLTYHVIGLRSPTLAPPPKSCHQTLPSN